VDCGFYYGRITGGNEVEEEGGPKLEERETCRWSLVTGKYANIQNVFIHVKNSCSGGPKAAV